jgi:hypothetical protein
MCSIGFNSTSTSKVDYLIATWLPQFVLSSYTTCMGFSVAAAQSMVDEQALTLLDNIKVLTNQSRVESLCKVIRCPGGRKANVAPGDPGAANLGIQVSLKAEFNLMLTAYWLCHQDRVSRIPNPADVTLASVRSLAALRKANLAYNKDTTKVPTIDAKIWPKLLEAIETYLCSCLGQKEIPLAYVVRRDTLSALHYLDEHKFKKIIINFIFKTFRHAFLCSPK